MSTTAGSSGHIFTSSENVTVFWQGCADQSSIEQLIMYRLQPKSDDKGDGTAAAVQEVLKDGADSEAYLWRMYLTL